jgi:ribose transport system substrate-binding protein
VTKENTLKSITIRMAIAVLAAVASITIGLSQVPTAAASKGTIAFLLSGPDIYYQDASYGAQAAAAKLGYGLKVYANPNGSPSVELANVQDAIDAGDVAITGYSVSYSSEGGTILAAGKAGVPTLLLSGYTPNYLGTKDFIGFETFASVAAMVPDGVFVKDHATGQVAVITGQLGRGDAEDYRTGFLEGLGCKGNLAAGLPPMTCAGGKMQYVVTETGKWLRPTAYTAAEDVITKYPNLAAVFVENEDMAVGVHTAFVAAHKSPLIVSANGAPYGLAGMTAGWLSATVVESPAFEGLMGVRLINAYLNRQISGSHLYLEPAFFITKASQAPTYLSWNLYKSPASVNAAMHEPLLKAVPGKPKYA